MTTVDLFITNKKTKCAKIAQCRKCQCVLTDDNWFLGNKARECKICNACVAAYRRSTYSRRSEEEKIRQRTKGRKKARNFRADILYHYGCKCVKCGETDVILLDLDHVANDGHIERKQYNLKQSNAYYKKVIKDNYPDRYQLLCANCNMKKAFECRSPKLRERIIKYLEAA